jgi:hypothetical protein
MAQRPPTVACDDVPLDEARRMSQGPRMNPDLYKALTSNIHALDDSAPHVSLPERTNPTTMHHGSLRVAAAHLRAPPRPGHTASPAARPVSTPDILPAEVLWVSSHSQDEE